MAKPEEVTSKVDSVNTDELENREGIIYLKGSETPYTGKVFDLWKNGKAVGSKLQGRQEGRDRGAVL